MEDTNLISEAPSSTAQDDATLDTVLTECTVQKKDDSTNRMTTLEDVETARVSKESFEAIDDEDNTPSVKKENNGSAGLHSESSVRFSFEVSKMHKEVKKIGGELEESDFDIKTPETQDKNGNSETSSPKQSNNIEIIQNEILIVNTLVNIVEPLTFAGTATDETDSSDETDISGESSLAHSRNVHEEQVIVPTSDVCTGITGSEPLQNKNEKHTGHEEHVLSSSDLISSSTTCPAEIDETQMITFEMDEDTSVMKMAGENARKHRENRNSKRFSSSDESQQKCFDNGKEKKESGSCASNPEDVEKITRMDSPMIDSGIAFHLEKVDTASDLGNTVINLDNANDFEETPQGLNRILTITEEILRGDVVPLKDLIWIDQRSMHRSVSSSVDPLDTDMSQPLSSEQGYPSDVDSECNNSPLFKPIAFSPIPFSKMAQFHENTVSGKPPESQEDSDQLDSLSTDPSVYTSSSVDPERKYIPLPFVDIVGTSPDITVNPNQTVFISQSTLLEADFVAGLTENNVSSFSRQEDAIPFESWDRLSQMASGARPKERSVPQSLDTSVDSAALSTLVFPSTCKSHELSSAGDVFLSPSIEDPFDDSFRLDTTGDDTDVFLDDADDLRDDGMGEFRMESKH